MYKKNVNKFITAITVSLLAGLMTTAVYADWESDANARIEQNRKRDVVLTVQNQAGTPLAQTDLNIKQVSHHFGFGSDISLTHLYRDYNYAKFFIENFEWATMSNVRWAHNEPVQGEISYAGGDQLYEFLHSHGIKIRGHHIFNNKGDQDWVRDISEPNQLFDAMESRITGVVSHFQGKFQHWDVNNEMVDDQERYHYEDVITHAFDGQNTPLRAWMFKRAHELDSSVELFVNETAIIGSDPAYMRFRDDAITLVQTLISQGAPVSGLGIQGHINTEYDRDVVVANFQALSAAGVPVWATEFHVENTNITTRADDLEDFFRIAFSMPHVEGIILWGFWGETTSTHPFPNAGIVGTDWVVNEAGLRYQALMDEWTTEINGTTDINGQISFRGFHGLYEVSGPNMKPAIIDVQPGTTTINLTAAPAPGADITGNGTLDLEDWAEFVANWQLCNDPEDPACQ